MLYSITIQNENDDSRSAEEENLSQESRNNNTVGEYIEQDMSYLEQDNDGKITIVVNQGIKPNEKEIIFKSNNDEFMKILLSKSNDEVDKNKQNYDLSIFNFNKNAYRKHSTIEYSDEIFDNINNNDIPAIKSLVKAILITGLNAHYPYQCNLFKRTCNIDIATYFSLDDKCDNNTTKYHYNASKIEEVINDATIINKSAKKTQSNQENEQENVNSKIEEVINDATIINKSAKKTQSNQENERGNVNSTAQSCLNNCWYCIKNLFVGKEKTTST